MVLEDEDFDDLVTSINVVSTELKAGGYGDRVLAAVFAYTDNGKPLYFIYNFKRGRFLPVRARARATRRATTSASSSSRPRWKARCRSSLSWSAGSRSGRPRSSEPIRRTIDS